MSYRGLKPYVFKPARRVFAGRGRSMLTVGEWKIAFAAMAFGAAVAVSWGIKPQSPAALAQPPLTMTAPPAAPQQAVIAAAQIETPPAPPSPSGFLIAEAARIVDGDTFYLEGVSTRIRLWGVDAPERGEVGFDAATDQLAALARRGMIACEQVDTDAYKRIVARCFTDDGRDLSGAMIESGAAREFLRYTAGYYGGD